MVRRKHFIGMMLMGLLAVAACTQRAKVPEPVEGPTAELLAIDTLMWHQSDSALACLLPYFDTCGDANFCVSTASAYNRHYANLLLSELLYKNDYAQVNRAELLQAVAYFDSISQVPEPVEGPSNRIAFLDARAHYINGVGYYEHDSVVEACAEYLKTLEVMESHFEEKDLVGHKARFMAFTYNRLGDMFYGQLLAEPAISCYKKALIFCMREPTSIYGISVILYNLGIQFDIARQKDSADYYYNQALNYMPDFDNIHYRDIIATKSVLAYNLGFCVDSVINNLKHVISLTSNDDERITRYLTLGNVLFEDKQYDSSCFYLETVFEQQEDIPSRILAAENLCSIYQMKGDSIKAQKYASFLAGFTMSEIEKKTEVSKVNEMFKEYLTKQQEKKAGLEREKAVKKTLEIIIPIAVVVALVIFIVSKKRNEKLLKKQQEEADKVLGETEQQHEEELRQRQAEAEKILEDKERSYQREMESERLTHKMQQAALSGRLKRSNEELRDVSSQLEQMLEKNVSSEAVHSGDYKAFVNTSICLYIVNLVHTQQFKSKMDYLIYKDNALSKEQLLALRDAAETNLPRFVTLIRKQFPKLTDNDMDYCYLFLLGLNEADISALMQRAYTTVCDRSRKISRIIGANESLYHTLRNMLYE